MRILVLNFQVKAIKIKNIFYKFLTAKRFAIFRDFDEIWPN